MLVNSSSAYSFKTPAPGGESYTGSASSAAAVRQPAPGAGTDKDPQPMGIVILWGPEQRMESLEAIRAATTNAELAFSVIETAGDHAQQHDIVRELYLGNALGPHTQLLACFASNTRAEVLVAEGGRAITALDLICWFRTPPMAGHRPLRFSWKGTIHAFWQQSGKVLDYYDPHRPLWKTGPAIPHACRKGGTDHNSITGIEDLCAYIGSVKGQGALLETAYIAARMLGVTGDTPGCAGGRFKRAVVAGAPRTSAQAQHDHLIASLEGGNGDQARVRGARQDVRALARAMPSGRPRQAVTAAGDQARERLRDASRALKIAGLGRASCPISFAASHEGMFGPQRRAELQAPLPLGHDHQGNGYPGRPARRRDKRQPSS